MSISAMTKVWKYASHGGGALLTELALADFADDDGHAFPSVATLAAKVRLTERQIRNILRQLEASGELRIEQGGGRYRRNHYWLQFKKAEKNNAENISVKSASQNPEICDATKPETLKSATQNPEADFTRSVREPSSKKDPSENRETASAALVLFPGAQPPEGPKTAKEKAQLVLHLWSSTAKNLPIPRKLVDRWVRNAAARLDEYGLDGLREIFERLNRSDFAQEGKWASFEWVIKLNSNCEKVLSGQYDNKRSKLPGGGRNKKNQAVYELYHDFDAEEAEINATYAIR